eukprot:scaffold22575_cov141-Cylindrotheca_fusiformis.AAC.31
MGNSASALPYSIDSQIGAPHDHNGWSLHNGTSTDGRHTEVSIFVGKKPLLAKTPASPKFSQQMQLIPALHHFRYSKKLRHPHILKVYATLDTDNPSESTTEGGAAAAAKVAATSDNGTGDLMIVTEPCMSLDAWLLTNPSPEQLAWGLECLVRGLHFMHASANLSHGNLSPSSFYVTRSGDVKLWNFSLVTQIGPNLGPDNHFRQWEQVCTLDAYRSPERVERRYDAISNHGVHAMDSYSLGVLIDHIFQGRIPQKLQKAVQRMQTPNIKMRPRLQPLLRCPIFDTPYQKLQLTLEDVVVQPVEQKIVLWQKLGSSMQTGALPKDVALYKILPLIQSSATTICTNEAMLTQDLYRREVLSMLQPLFFIVETHLEPEKISKELGPLVALLFKVKDRGVRGGLLGKVGFMSQHLDKNSLNSHVFEPLCTGFNDSNATLRELTLKATLGLVPFLTPPNLEKLTRYLVRLQSDTETSIRTNAVIFVSKIAPEMGIASREKHLFPAFARAMKDAFPPARLAALQAIVQTKGLFSPQDVAVKVLPGVMPLLLDPMTDVRNEAFKVVNSFMGVLQEESIKMAQRQRQQQQKQQASGGPVAPGVPTKGAVAPSPASSGSYISGLTSWMAGTTSTATPAAPAVAAAPASAPIAPTPAVAPTVAAPVQQFAATSLTATTIADDDWGDDTGGWGDDEDANDLAFSNIGATTAAKPQRAFSSSMEKPVDDDPFAAIGMKTTGGTKLSLNKKKGGGLVLPKATAAATKLSIDNDDLADGWDDF